MARVENGKEDRSHEPQFPSPVVKPSIIIRAKDIEKNEREHEDVVVSLEEAEHRFSTSNRAHITVL
jgi:hypothetical protein